MFRLSVLIGLYSYAIFFLGILRVLYKENIILLTIAFFLIIAYQYQSSLRFLLTRSLLAKLSSLRLQGDSLYKLSLLLLVLLFLQAFVNLIGALGPELAFDALWYHLTLPKIYLMNDSIVHISGGLFYYSDMPKLTEMIYIAALSLSNEIGAKLIHFSFGILSTIALFKLSRKFFSKYISLLVIVVFYSNLVVAWQSTTAYIDLTRTFFEIMALWGFINWWETKKKRWLIESAAMLGLAISTKLLAIGSLVIFIALILFTIPQVSIRIHPKGVHDNTLTTILLYSFVSILIPFPWFIFSYFHTGNPIYPFFTNIYKVNFDAGLLNPLRFLYDTWNLFIRSSDPISPVYIMFLPLALVFFKRLSLYMKIIVLYSLLSIIVLYITPRTGGGRFILPYLPTMSIVVGAVIQEIIKIKNLRIIANLSTIIVIFVSLISIIYRGVANAKYIPAIIGKESKSEFLSKNLNFSFGDFYDVDGYFKKNIKSNDKVLLYGFHNLYYIDFPFIDSSFVKKGDIFNYVATQNSDLPKRFRSWDPIYSNPKTYVNLYSVGGKKWIY